MMIDPFDDGVSQESARRSRMIEAANAAYAAMRNDPVAWQEELDERRAWDVTLADGLDPDDVTRIDVKAFPT